MTARICPDDGTKLIEIDRFGTIIDFCPACHGAWLDVSELEDITEYAARRLARLKIEKCGRDFDQLTDQELNALFQRQFNVKNDTPERRCPCDGVTLEHKVRHGVVVDWCPLCRGIWVDRGEIEAIVHITAHQLAMTRCLKAIDQGDLPLPRDVMAPQPLPIINHPNRTIYHPRDPAPPPRMDPRQLKRLLADQDERPYSRAHRLVAGAAIGAKIAKIAYDLLSG